MSFKQTILIVHNHYQMQGGEDIAVFNEKKLLEDHGHRVILYTRNNDEIKEFGFLQKLALPFESVFNPRTYRDILRIIRQERIDIIHVHNTLPLISPSVFYAAVRAKTPVFHTLHNFRMQCPNGLLYRDGNPCEDCIRKGLRSALRHRCYRNSFLQTFVLVITMMIHRMTGIYKRVSYICLTEFNKEKLLMLNRQKKVSITEKRVPVINPERVFVKPNFTWDTSAGFVPYEEREGIVFVGRLEKNKGIDIILKAWVKLHPSSRSHLTVCGTGPLEIRCKAFVKQQGLSETVGFTGQIGHEEAIKKMSEAKALIFASRLYEGLPMTILEALSVGTPVIVSDIGNASEVIIEGVTGKHFRNGQSESLAEAVRQIMNETFDVQDIRENYRKVYAPESSYEELSSIYRTVQAA